MSRLPALDGLLTTIFDDLSVLHEQNPVRPFSKCHVMGDEQNAALLFPVQVKQQLKNCLAGDGIKISGRFIGKDPARATDQRPCDYDPLLLTTGQLGR